VHQGDQDGRKGIYHINAVDQVTQWKIVAATPQISELWLIPLLETTLQQFPFVIRRFHSDNGIEFINYTVARLLGKLLIEQTKSRAYHTGDNGLVEAKNGAMIRKLLGFGHIGVQHAAAVDTFIASSRGKPPSLSLLGFPPLRLTGALLDRLTHHVHTWK
jgi:transposase InsO family protein